MRAVWLSISVAALGWGTSGVATRAALAEGGSPYEIATFRSLIGAVAVVGFLVVRRMKIPRGGPALKTGMIMGVSNLAMPFLLSNIALQYASAGFLGLMTALIPLLTAVLAHFMLPAERLTMVKTAGLLVALSGVAVLLLSGDSGLAEGGRPVLAGSLGLLAALGIAYGGTYAKIHAGEYEPLHVTGIHFTSGAAIIAVAALIAEGPPAGQTAEGWALVAYMGIFCTFMPFVIFYRLLRRVSATYASMVGYVVPLVAVIAGVVLLDERLQPGIVFGGLLIFAGVVLTHRAEQRVVVVPAEAVPEELISGPEG
ncbi:MAG TPA: DMT family transporter [Acidimicrobiia bacterium]|jgi:drug/metabolite transporter (DMT)-like permease